MVGFVGLLCNIPKYKICSNLRLNSVLLCVGQESCYLELNWLSRPSLAAGELRIHPFCLQHPNRGARVRSLVVSSSIHSWGKQELSGVERALGNMPFPTDCRRSSRLRWASWFSNVDLRQSTCMAQIRTCQVVFQCCIHHQMQLSKA